MKIYVMSKGEEGLDFFSVFTTSHKHKFYNVTRVVVVVVAVVVVVVVLVVVVKDFNLLEQIYMWHNRQYKQ